MRVIARLQPIEATIVSLIVILGLATNAKRAKFFQGRPTLL